MKCHEFSLMACLSDKHNTVNSSAPWGSWFGVSPLIQKRPFTNQNSIVIITEK